VKQRFTEWREGWTMRSNRHGGAIAMISYTYTPGPERI
jgi:hypothetical protein